MGIKVRVGNLNVKLTFDRLLSPAARSRLFAQQAQGILDEADDTNRQILGRVPNRHTFVDGREDAPLDSVSYPGVIVREYDLVLDVLQFIAEELRQISPVGSKPDKRPGHPGFYRDSHTLFADGIEVPVSETIPDAREYVFLSTAPYARRVERRSTVYELTAAKASQRFGNIAKVYFSWRAPYSGEILTGSRGNKSDGRMPAIIVTIGR
jgi:hypothetical protein